jgi:hypothetical protein
MMNLIGVSMMNIKEDYKPLFEYPKYLKNYDYRNINYTIYNWIESYSYSQKYDETGNFISMFHQSILRLCINIEQFSIDLESYTIYKQNFYYIIATNFKKLKSLKLKLQTFDNKVKKNFLNNIANYCINLKEFEISSSNQFDDSSEIQNDVVEIINTIIQKQNNLENFIIVQYPLNDIFISLEFQKHSLVSIEFKNIDFYNVSFKNFINLYNLNHLRFDNCKDIKPLERYEILKFASFKLKKLEFHSNYWNEKIELTIIKYLGKSLQSLSILKEMTIPMIENISIYCLNLITLEVLITGSIDLLVFTYFKNLKIRILNINTICPYHNNMNVFLNLGNNLPINVKEISLMPLFPDNAQSQFKIFLENCHNYLEKINLSHDLIGPEFLKVILNYIESSNNSLIILKFSRIIRVLDDEELKLLDEIKAKGVKIDLYSILPSYSYYLQTD